MAKSIKLGSDTYLDSQGVMMRSTGSTTRKTLSEWGQGIIGTEYVSISTGNSVTFTLGASAVIFVLCGGINTNANGFVVMTSSANADAYVAKVAGAADLAISRTGSTVTFTNNNTYTQRLLLLVCSGLYTKA